MTHRRTIPVLITAFALAFPSIVRTDGGGTNDNQDDKLAADDAIVNFGDPVVLAGVANQVLVPDDTTIRTGGTVTFVVNGDNHGIAIYPVSKNTTRDDIAAQLCIHNPATNACVDPAFANAGHTTLDGKGHMVIVTGPNPPVQRVEDPTDRLLGTAATVGNVAGPFLPGTTATAAGTRLQFRFDKSGRYLAVCMNRNHYLNNRMFGFINVVGNDDNE